MFISIYLMSQVSVYRTIVGPLVVCFAGWGLLYESIMIQTPVMITTVFVLSSAHAPINTPTSIPSNMWLAYCYLREFCQWNILVGELRFKVLYLIKSKS